MSVMCENVTKCQFPSRNAAILYGLSPFSEILYGLSPFSYVPGSPPRGQPSSRSATHHSIRKASGPAPGTGCNATFKQLTTRRMGPRPVPSAVSFLDPVLEKMGLRTEFYMASTFPRGKPPKLVTQISGQGLALYTHIIEYTNHSGRDLK